MKTTHFLLLFLSFILLFSGYGKIETGKVNLNGRVLYVGGSGPNNYTSIQDAIDDALPGDTIFVYSGVYYENVRVYKSINLIGENEETTIIDGRNESNVTVFSIEADNVKFSHFTVRNAPGGEWVRGVLVKDANNVSISNCRILHSEGFSICDSANVYIENCNISHNLYGIDLINHEMNNRSYKIIVRNCTFMYNYAKKEDEWYVGGGFGISMVFFKVLADVTIENCRIFHNGEGIGISDPASLLISNCTVIDYNISGIGVGGDLHINSDCIISNCSVLNGYIGIGIGRVNATVKNCYVAGNIFGIDISHSAGRVTVRYNTVVNNTYGIYVFGKMLSHHINYNNIYDNEFGLKAEFTIVDARYNYWGSPLGPSHLFGFRGDKIETFFAKVIYFPWLTEECDQ